MTETEKELLVIKKLLKMSPLFGLLGDFFEVLTNPDKYGPLFRELGEAHAALDLVVSAVGPAAEIPGMHARAQEAHVEAEGLLIQAKAAAEATKSEAKEAKTTIITKARAEADDNKAEIEARLEAQRVKTQEGTDQLAKDVAVAIQAAAMRVKSVKDREDRVGAAEKALKKAQTKLDIEEVDLTRRLDNLNAAMQKSR